MSFSGFTNAHLAEFQRELNSAVLKDMRSNKDNIAVTVLAVDITIKESKPSLGCFYVLLKLLKRNRTTNGCDVILNSYLEPK